MDLHTAAREGNIAEVRRIIATGAKLDDRDKHSRTPLHMAGWAGHVSPDGFRDGVTLTSNALSKGKLCCC
jgi:ankyrin repeat protein